MDSFNKVISFVLGLVVVLVFFAVVTGKINLKSKNNTTLASAITPTPTQDSGGFFSFLKRATPTPTPTTESSSIDIDTNTSKNNSYKQNNQVSSQSNAKSIPSTGLPTIFIPLLFSGLAGGGFLSKIGKKK